MYRRVIYRLAGAVPFYLRHRECLLRLPVWLGLPILFPLDCATRAVRRRAQVLLEDAESLPPAESTLCASSSLSSSARARIASGDG